MSKISDVIGGKRDEFILRITIATALFSEKFYAGQENDWGKVTSDEGKRAEAQFNDPESGVYGSTQFANTIKAMTGEELKLRMPRALTYQVGVAVVPVAPVYGKRTEDGYALDKVYLCTNETSGGKFRNAETAVARMTTGSHNQVGLMSRLSDEVRPATEEEIVALVDSLLAVKGLTLMHDLEPELARYDAFIK